MLRRISKWDAVLSNTEGVKSHPPFVVMPKKVHAWMIELFDLNSLVIRQQPQIGTCTGSFILKYSSKDSCKGIELLEMHRDEHKVESKFYGMPVYTVVLTICDEGCCVGSMSISNRRDGNVSHSKDAVTLDFPDNSLYAFYGSAAAHALLPVKKGVRYALVFFFTTSETFLESQRSWAEPPDPMGLPTYQCKFCIKNYGTARGLKEHRCKPLQFQVSVILFCE
jgi:hypothetical protein